MANFNTHVSIAAASSGLLSTAILQLSNISNGDALTLTLLGTIGGILPDIDLRDSHPSRMLFSFLGIVCAFILVFALDEQFSIVELWLSASLVFLCVRYPIWFVFHDFTQHRGATHSIIAAIMFVFITTMVSHQLFALTPLMAWFCGFFVGFGFIVHLLLDELYSVDFSSNRIKRSFGSAMKLLSVKHWIGSLFIVAIAVSAAMFCPNTEDLQVFFSQTTISKLNDNLLPTGAWFGTGYMNNL